jgi:hypothetical protein
MKGSSCGHAGVASQDEERWNRAAHARRHFVIPYEVLLEHPLALCRFTINVLILLV